MLTKEIIEEELGLKTIRELIKNYKIILIVFPLILTSIALISIMRLPPLFEATALIEVGQFNPRMNVDDELEPVAHKVVSVDETIATLRSQAFVKQILSMPEVQTDHNNVRNFLYNDTLRAVPLDDKIEMKLRANSPALAIKLTQLAVSEVNKAHNDRYLKITEAIKKRINHIDEKIEALENRNKVVRRNINIDELKTTNERLLGAILTEIQNVDIRKLEERRIELSGKLKSAGTFPTRLLGPLTVTELRSEPKRFMLVFVAFAIGTMLGFIVSFMIHIYRREKVS